MSRDEDIGFGWRQLREHERPRPLEYTALAKEERHRGDQNAVVRTDEGFEAEFDELFRGGPPVKHPTSPPEQCPPSKRARTALQGLFSLEDSAPVPRQQPQQRQPQSGMASRGEPPTDSETTSASELPEAGCDAPLLLTRTSDLHA
eukprot:Sspe_Gene.115623::Locus_103256_Transcript_1_1_Confidence_1.000_Length_533::g.115623::m.115623